VSTKKSVQLLGVLTDSQSQLCFSVYLTIFKVTDFVFFFFAKRSSGSTNYAKKAHPAQYIKYAINAVVNSELWGNL
jgi:hypothetical protein